MYSVYIFDKNYILGLGGFAVLVRAVRGATTVLNNSKDEILYETRILIKTIMEKNNIKMDDLISIFFTVTKDLNTAFPAFAAREFGLTNVSLLCTNEIDVPNSLEKCVRTLVHFNTARSNSEIKHVYLNDSKQLRPDLSD